MLSYILSVGDEVLSGKTINTNAAFIASFLEKLGIATKKVIVVGDDEKMISSSVKEFLESDAKILITSGGLGPTHDDFTKEVISSTLGLKLVYNEDAAMDMCNYFKEKKVDCNTKQSLIPEGASIIPNKIGSADGIILEYNNKIIIMLVGPPYELQPMLASCEDYLKKYSEIFLIQEFITMGNSESFFENLLKDLINKYDKVNIAPYADNGKVRFRILSEAQYKDSFNKAVDEFIQIMDEFIISSKNESIEEVVVKKLKEKGLKISFAESITGGMLASLITNVAGASLVIDESLVTYSEEAKAKYLSIPLKNIKEYGVVSKEIALQMVEGLDKLTHSDITVSVTGFAGPTGIDVGKVCYAIKYKDVLINEEKRFRGSRDMIRTRVSRHILYLVYKILK